MTDGEYFGYTSDDLRVVAGTAIGLTLGPLIASPVDGWGVERFAFALGCGVVALCTALAFHRL